MLIKHPAATFLVRVHGNSMIKAGINHDDILIVDRSLKPQNNNIVIACLEGELTVKKFIKRLNKVFLAPANSKYKEVEVKDDEELLIWGVVTSIIQRL